MNMELPPPLGNGGGCFRRRGAEPDLAQCAADATEMNGLARCLGPPGSELCPYALPFGEGFFCTHPQRDQIVARTRGSAPPPAA